MVNTMDTFILDAALSDELTSEFMSVMKQGNVAQLVKWFQSRGYTVSESDGARLVGELRHAKDHVHGMLW